LNESITLKKTWERLSRQLGRAELAAETTAAHLRVYLPKEQGGMFAEALWPARLTLRDGKAESWYLCSIAAEDA
jgi:hypothetical protein